MFNTRLSNGQTGLPLVERRLDRTRRFRAAMTQYTRLLQPMLDRPVREPDLQACYSVRLATHA